MIKGGHNLTPYNIFSVTSGAMPAFYYDVDSMEQRIHHICHELKKLAKYADYLGFNVGVNADAIDKLEADFEKFKESGYVDYYERQVWQWIADNMERLISESMKMVYFGLNDDGYFVAYVPDSWEGIEFDTGAVFGTQEYGRLILEFEPTKVVKL